MKTYSIQYSKRFDKEIHKIDKVYAIKILEFLKQQIDNCSNPRFVGKPLKGNKKGLWRYRIGDYRIICDIQDKECIVLALEPAHRKDIYK
jgi:mRNA interferase RelE/StbE